MNVYDHWRTKKSSLTFHSGEKNTSSPWSFYLTPTVLVLTINLFSSVFPLEVR